MSIKNYFEPEKSTAGREVVGRLRDMFRFPKVEVKINAPKVHLGDRPQQASVSPAFSDVSKGRGYCYPDGKGGWRLIWQRKDGTTSESYSKLRPSGFRYANSKAQAEVLAGKVPVPVVKPMVEGKAVKPEVEKQEAEKPEVKAEQPFYLEPPAKVSRSKGVRISQPMPRLR